MTEATKVAIKAKFDEWMDPDHPTTKYEFYGFLRELRDAGVEWGYGEVADLTDIEEPVIRMRVDYLDKIGGAA